MAHGAYGTVRVMAVRSPVSLKYASERRSPNNDYFEMEFRIAAEMRVWKKKTNQGSSNSKPRVGNTKF